MVHLRMKNIVVSVFLIIGIITPSRANDTDSLVYEDLQFVKKRINLMLYRLNEMNQAGTSSLDSIMALSDQSLEGLESLERNISAEHTATRDSLLNKTAQLEKSMNENQKKYRENAIMHYIFHGVAIGLIIFLIIYVRWERRKSLQYLISRTED